MDNTIRHRAIRRQLLTLLSFCIGGAGCTMPALKAAEPGVEQQRRFRGVGIVLVVDAVPKAEMAGVVFYDDWEQRIYASSIVAKRNRSVMALGGTRIPVTVRALWRDRPKPVWGRHGAIDYEGAIIGDHTIPVAERIPDEVLRDIRAKGGALRLKFRLKPDGVLFGWDIERPGGGISRFDMPGGDFLETRY